MNQTMPTIPAEATQTSRIPRLGWGLVLASHLLLLPLPNTFDSNLSVQLFAILAAFVLSILLLGGGLLLLIWRYRPFFCRPGGILLFVIIQTIGLALIGTPLAADAPWLLHRLALIGGVWALLAIPSVGLTMVIYLWVQDRSVPFFAVSMLILVWALVFLVRAIGPAKLLAAIVAGSATQWLGALNGLWCVLWWVVLLAPAGFLLHTVRLLYQEWAGETIYHGGEE